MKAAQTARSPVQPPFEKEGVGYFSAAAKRLPRFFHEQGGDVPGRPIIAIRQNKRRPVILC